MNLPQFGEPESRYTRQHAGAYYLDGEPLKRPFYLTRPVIAVCAGAMIIASLIGGTFAFKAIDAVMHGEERAEAAIQESINREISYDLPKMHKYIALDDNAIMHKFEKAGFETYNFLGEGEEGIDCFKIPSDTTMAEATAALAGGIGGMNASDAAKFLVGSWRFTTEHGDAGTTMSVKYADLQSTDAKTAIEQAMISEGWSGEISDGSKASKNVKVTDEGTDEMGNTYKTGTIKTKSGKFIWRVSACNLSDVYDISGLPKTAQFVGIRISE